MLSFTGGLKVFVALEPVDLRKSFSGLEGLVSARLGEDLRQGALFVFSSAKPKSKFLSVRRVIAHCTEPLVDRQRHRGCRSELRLIDGDTQHGGDRPAQPSSTDRAPARSKNGEPFGPGGLYELAQELIPEPGNSFVGVNGRPLSPS